MPCFHPLQAYYSLRSDGKKDIKFSNTLSKVYAQGGQVVDPSSVLMIPCGRCMGCRLERSRQWAVRIMHEAQLYEDNCFITLTFNEDSLPKMCPDGSLNKKHMQDFMKRLRRKFDDRLIRVFYCGEYGDDFARPHYHACLFNVAFSDQRLWGKIGDFPYYTSDVLSSLWPFGYSSISELNFESAAYVARYCTKKVTGSKAKDHYGDRLPEFSQASLKPGIGSGWLDKYGRSDCFNHDQVVVRGKRCKPPRYYDKRLESVDPALFDKTRETRLMKASRRSSDNTYKRLLVKEACCEARLKKLVRRMDKGNIYDS